MVEPSRPLAEGRDYTVAILGGYGSVCARERGVVEKGFWGCRCTMESLRTQPTLSDVIGRGDPVAFRDAFTAWATDALPNLVGEQVCVEGKAVRGSRDGENPAVHLVSAFVGKARRVLTLPVVVNKDDAFF